MASLASEQILDLIAKQDRPGLKGRLMVHMRAARDGMNAVVIPTSQVRFLKDLEESIDDRPKRHAYSHPARDARAKSPGRPKESLEPSDLAWLNRLPNDPAQVPYDDAVSLARLAGQVRAFKNESDARLVNSVWAPVKELHDVADAKVSLANAARPLPRVPSSALPALADAVRTEVPALEPDEAIARAGVALRETVENRNRSRQHDVLAAQARVAAAQRATADRKATVKPVDA